MRIDSYSYTNRGKYEINEDSVLCGDNIFAVADGLGGCDGGENASACAVKYLSDNYSGCSEEELEALIAGANSAVFSLGGDSCTTVAAAFTDGKAFRFTNVGDSRVYYFREGRLLMRTKDHSVCQAAVETGTMSEEEIRGSDDRSKLLRVLGRDGEIKPAKILQPDGVCDGDAFIICSDGFWDYVYETEMEIDLLKSGSARQWAEYMLRRHLMRSHCGDDNF
ncbi:MAG: protein phosphatase 2C domain-containing protein, partial [Butyrivibrio sp.]|nr:protein phosphatase 2C domain-containing protein [Butyrivibrio sp.]